MLFNLEPKYRVTMVTREGWTRGTETHPVLKGLVWFTDGSRTKEGTVAGVDGYSVGRRLSISLEKYATVFKTDIHAILTSAYEIQTNARPEKCISICYDSEEALKALLTVNKRLSWCNSAKRRCMISTQNTVGLYWVPGHAGVRGNDFTDRVTRDGSVQKSVGPEPSLGGL